MIRFNLEGPTDVFATLASRLDDLTPVYRDIGEYLIVATRQRFIDGVGPDGQAWAPSAGDNPTLLGESKRLSREWSYVATPGGLDFGSPLEYAATMHFGARAGQFGTFQIGEREIPIPWGDIPSRKILGLSGDDQSAIRGIESEHLEGFLP